jgi:hypothetical protein
MFELNSGAHLAALCTRQIQASGGGLPSHAAASNNTRRVDGGTARDSQASGVDSGMAATAISLDEFEQHATYSIGVTPASASAPITATAVARGSAPPLPNSYPLVSASCMIHVIPTSLLT